MQFDTTYLTEAGRELATSTLGGLDKIQFTRAVASSHDYSATAIEDLKKLTDIEGVEQEVQYSRIVKKDKTTLTMRVDFPSKDVEKAYSLYTVGFYARLVNGGEVLYGVLPSSLPDYVPAYDGHSNINDSFQTDTTVNDTDNVMITVTQAGALNEDDLEAIFAAKHVATIEDIKNNLPDTLADTAKANHFKGANVFDKAPTDADGNGYVTASGAVAANAPAVSQAASSAASAANTHADSGDASTLTAANAHADTGDADTLKTTKDLIAAALADMLGADGSLTIGDKTFKPVPDNGNGTITVDKQVITPADEAHVVAVNEAGNGSKVNFDYGNLTVDQLAVLGFKVMYDTEDYATWGAAHPNAMLIVLHKADTDTTTTTGGTTA